MAMCKRSAHTFTAERALSQMSIQEKGYVQVQCRHDLSPMYYSHFVCKHAPFYWVPDLGMSWQRTCSSKTRNRSNWWNCCSKCKWGVCSRYLVWILLEGSSLKTHHQSNERVPLELQIQLNCPLWNSNTVLSLCGLLWIEKWDQCIPQSTLRWNIWQVKATIVNLVVSDWHDVFRSWMTVWQLPLAKRINGHV